MVLSRQRRKVDFVALLRRLWRGERIIKHDGPAGRFPYLQLNGTPDARIPMMWVALGEKSLELAGRCMDGVVLHTFFGDEAIGRSLAAVRRGAEQAGRDPAKIRVWSVLATVGDHLGREAWLTKVVGRLASYLQAGPHGELLIKANAWDPALIQGFRSDPFVAGFRGSFDSKATLDELEYLAKLLPSEWLGIAATGSPEQCAAAINHQFELGVDSVILHGCSPAELAPILPAYRANRMKRVVGLPRNPGWSQS